MCLVRLKVSPGKTWSWSSLVGLKFINLLNSFMVRLSDYSLNQDELAQLINPIDNLPRKLRFTHGVGINTFSLVM